MNEFNNNNTEKQTKKYVNSILYYKDPIQPVFKNA